MNENTNTNTAAIMMVAQMITSAIEKGFALAEANAKRAHEETMYSLETSRITAQAQARLADAQASEIEFRIQTNRK
jgi:hypothetical protein